MASIHDEHIEPVEKEILVIDVIKKQFIRGLLIYLLVSNVFVFLRIVLRLFGANPDNLFAGFIFIVSGLFLLPFFGIFPRFQDEIVANDPTFDVSAFIAIFCSNILLFLAMSLIYIFARMLKTRKQADETVETSKPVDTTGIEETID